jgi:hypothetical protein
VHWPAIIKIAGDAELIYLAGESAWHDDPDLHAFEYDENDRLIDASGHLFALNHRRQGRVQPRPVGSSMALYEVLGLIKAHAAQKGSCCVSKLYAPTIAEAFGIVASLEDG